MMKISKSLSLASQVLGSKGLNKYKNLTSISSKLFASKKKDGATQSDKEVDKSKKTVKASSSSSESSNNSASNVKVIESIPGDKVFKNLYNL